MHRLLQPNFSKSLYKSVLIRYLSLSSNWLDILIISMYSLSQLIKALEGYVDLKVLLLMKDTGLVVLKMKTFIISEQEYQKKKCFDVPKYTDPDLKGSSNSFSHEAFMTDLQLPNMWRVFFFNVDTCQE